MSPARTEAELLEIVREFADQLDARGMSVVQARNALASRGIPPEQVFAALALGEQAKILRQARDTYYRC